MIVSRRQLMGAALIAGLAIASGCRSPSGADAAGRSAIILVHGAWHGGWVWAPVADRLRAAGYFVYAPDLTGLGERQAERIPVPGLSTHVEDIVSLVRRENLTDVILVGHSYGGMVITGAASELAGRVAGLVYLDAALPEHGQSMITQNPETATPEAAETVRVQLAALAPDGIWMQPLPPQAFGIPETRADLIALMADKLTDHPLPTWTEAVSISTPITGLPRGYVWCNNPALMPSSFAYHAQRVRDGQAGAGWTYYELPTGHNAMLTLPDAVARIILDQSALAGLSPHSP